MTEQSKLAKAFAECVRAAIGGDKAHGWGIADSAEVIETLIAEDAPEGYAPSDECMKLIREVINPSQFRQKLEAAGKLAETKRAKADKGLKDLMASI